MIKTLISKWNDPNKNISYSIPKASLMQVPSNSGMLMLGRAGIDVRKTARSILRSCGGHHCFFLARIK
jgi:hypothetical protein